MRSSNCEVLVSKCEMKGHRVAKRPQEDERVEIVSRTYAFGLRVLKFCQFLFSQKGVERPLTDQLLRSGTAVGALVEEAQSAESRADFRHKMSVSAKESRESVYWLRLIRDAGIVDGEKVDPLISEGIEIRNVLRAIVKKVRD